MDVDIVVKVLSRTVFSPFFVGFVPLLYIALGAPSDHSVVVQSTLWFICTLLFWSISFSSRLWRNPSFRSPPLDWGEQLVLITGGASGVGALLANTLAIRNVSVVVLDIRPFQSQNDNITSYICDVSDWANVQAVYNKIIRDVGHPTVIVNNAAVAQGKLLLDLSQQDIQQTFGVNLFSHFWTLKAFLPDLVKNNAGHIITIGSVMGDVGSAQMTDYCASKAALQSLHESLRYELDKRYHAPNVRTTLVLTGHIATPLFSTTSFPTNLLFRFLAPTLSTHTVVKAIIAAIDQQHSTTIRLPFYVHLVPFLKFLPSYLRDFFQWFSGADWAMRDFVKVSGRRLDE